MKEMERDWRQEPGGRCWPLRDRSTVRKGPCVTHAAPNVCPFTDISRHEKILLLSVTDLLVSVFHEFVQKLIWINLATTR